MFADESSLLRRVNEQKKIFYLNDELITFVFTVIWRRIHLVKDHRDNKRGNPLLPLHVLLFAISGTDRIAHATAFVTPVMDIWLGKKISMGRPGGIDPTTHNTLSGRFTSQLCPAPSGRSVVQASACNKLFAILVEGRKCLI